MRGFLPSLIPDTPAVKHTVLSIANLIESMVLPRVRLDPMQLCCLVGSVIGVFTTDSVLPRVGFPVVLEFALTARTVRRWGCQQLMRVKARQLRSDDGSTLVRPWVLDHGSATDRL